MTDDEETQTNMPTNPPPASADGDTLEAARTKAAIAILTRIEAVANHADVDANKLERLATAYRAVTPRRDEPIIGQIGTTLEPIAERQLDALSGFFEGVRHVCGLPGTRMTPERIQETVEAVTELRRKGNAYSNIRSELQAANEECASLREQVSCYRSMLHAMDTVINTEHKKLGIPPRVTVSDEETKIIEHAHSEVDVAERARHAARIALIRQMVEVGVNDRAIVKESREMLAKYGFDEHELTVGRIEMMGEALVKAQLRLNQVSKAAETGAVTDQGCAIQTMIARLHDADLEEFASVKRALAQHKAPDGPAGQQVANALQMLEASRYELNTIRSLLAKDGFTDDQLPRAVECALDSLIEVRKERDSSAETLRSVAAALRVVSVPLSLADGVQWLSDQLAATAKERDVLRSNILRIQEALGSMPDSSHLPNTGSVVDTAKAVAALVAECQTLRQEHATTIPRLATLLGTARAWTRDWGRQGSFFAGELREALAKAFGRGAVSAAECLKEAQGTNEIGAIVGVAKETIKDGDFVAVDITGMLRAAGPFSMSEGHETSRDAIDAVVHGGMRPSLVEAPPLAAASEPLLTRVPVGKQIIRAFDSNEGFATPSASPPTPPVPSTMPNVFDCGCSKHKVAAGRCDVYDASGKPRAEKPTPPEATRLQPPVFGKGSF